MASDYSFVQTFKGGLLSQGFIPGAPLTPGQSTPRPVPESPASLLGKRDPEGLRKGNNRTGSRFRGVTKHCRTGRFEAHMWQSKQVYLGGFYVEEMAALAYDLAAIRFRGQDATTNFPQDHFTQELAESEAGRPAPWDVVQSLRSQSKVMNRIEPLAGDSQGIGIGICMRDWELLLSSAVNKDKLHVGVFSSEVDAARAYDRALVSQKGIEAAAFLNFALVDYVDLLDPQQISAGVAQGALPPSLPLNFAPASEPLPSFHLHNYIAGMVASEPQFGAGGPVQMRDENDHDSKVVHRRQSTTPRSILDFETEGTEMQLQEVSITVQSGKPGPQQEKKSSKTQNEANLMNWIDDVVI